MNNESGKQLALFGCSEKIPAELFCFSESSWENLLASEELDKQYPVEEISRGKNEKGNWRIFVRNIESGVWLWGVDVCNKKTQHGQGFYPFRKWGIDYASMSKEGAIVSAIEYIENFLRE